MVMECFLLFCEREKNIIFQVFNKIFFFKSKGNIHMVEKIVDRALSSLSANGVEINRENWFQEAIEAEKSGAVNCCQAIIKSIIETGVEEEDRKQTWMDDAEFVSVSKFIILN